MAALSSRRLALLAGRRCAAPCGFQCRSAAPSRQADRTVEAKAWTLIDARTGEVLDSHAAKKELPIASTTKLMTAYVALQELPLGKIVHAAPYHPITASPCSACAPARRSASATSSTG